MAVSLCWIALQPKPGLSAKSTLDTCASAPTIARVHVCVRACKSLHAKHAKRTMHSTRSLARLPSHAITQELFLKYLARFPAALT
jgi:hypothetical protein